MVAGVESGLPIHGLETHGASISGMGATGCVFEGWGKGYIGGSADGQEGLREESGLAVSDSGL